MSGSVNSQWIVRGLVVFQQDLQQQVQNHFVNDLHSSWVETVKKWAIKSLFAHSIWLDMMYKICSILKESTT